MKIQTSSHKIDWAMLSVVMFFLIAASLLLPHFLYNIVPDGFSYLSIAQKYLDGDFQNALNGYWGPLLSWLLLPFMFAGIKAPLAVKLLSVIIGLIVILQSNFLIKLLKISQRLRVIILFVIAINAIYFALIEVTPDFLLVCLALSYMNIIFSPFYSNSIFAGISCGIMGALLYLTKAYGFPFFVVHFFVINFILFIRNNVKSHRIGIRRNYIIGMVFFLLISIPWILLISNKYGYLTIGTSGKFNQDLVVPNSSGFPQHHAGLLAPPNSTAFSVWEDICNENMPDCQSFNSFTSLQFQISNVCLNVYRTMRSFFHYSFLSFFLLAGSVFYLIKQGKQFVYDKIFLFLISMLIFVSGYLLIIVVDRYIWLCNFLLIIMGTRLLEILFKQLPFKKITLMLIIIIFAVSFLIQPVCKLYSVSRETPYIVKLNNLIAPLEIKGRIASNWNWEECIWLAYFNDWRYYGEKGDLSDAELQSQLESYKIDYFFLWASERKTLEFIDKYSEITNGTIDQLKIYDLNQPAH